MEKWLKVSTDVHELICTSGMGNTAVVGRATFLRAPMQWSAYAIGHSTIMCKTLRDAKRHIEKHGTRPAGNDVERQKQVRKAIREAIVHHFDGVIPLTESSNEHVAHLLGSIQGTRVTAEHVQAVRRSLMRKSKNEEIKAKPIVKMSKTVQAAIVDYIKSNNGAFGMSSYDIAMSLDEVDGERVTQRKVQSVRHMLKRKLQAKSAKAKLARSKRVANDVREGIANYLDNWKYTEKLSNSAVAHTLGTINGTRVTALHVQAVRASMKRKQESARPSSQAISLHPLNTAERAIERIERELIEAKEELARTRALFESASADRICQLCFAEPTRPGKKRRSREMQKTVQSARIQMAPRAGACLV